MGNEPAARNTKVTVAFSGVATVVPRDIPPPTNGQKAMIARLAELIHDGAADVRVTEIANVTIARPTASAEAFLKPFTHTVLDRNGVAMGDRQIAVLSHEDISHPWELQLYERGRSRRFTFGYFADSFAAYAVGQLWQEGRIDVDLATLPPSVDQATDRTVALSA